jgi:hypothetical protein
MTEDEHGEHEHEDLHEKLDEEREEKHEVEHELEAEREDRTHDDMRRELREHVDMITAGMHERLTHIEESIAGLTVAAVTHEEELGEHADVIDEHADVLEEVLEEVEHPTETPEHAEEDTEASEAGAGEETHEIESGVLTVVPSTVEHKEEKTEVRHTSRRWGR